MNTEQPKTNLEKRTLLVSPARILYPREGVDTAGSFCVIKAKILEHKDKTKIGQLITCKGNMHPVHIGARYRATGEPVKDKKYNEWQLSVSEWIEVVSLDRAGIISYLTRECNGVGEKIAGKIFDNLGAKAVETLASMSESQANDLKIKLGISTGKMASIRTWAISEGANAKLKEDLYSIGIHPWQVASLMKHFGLDAYRKIKEQCYDLTSVHGFGFKTVDEIARKIGVRLDDPNRIRSGIIYSLKSFCDESGSVCCGLDKLVFAACAVLCVDKKLVAESLKGLSDDGILVCE